MGFSLFSGPGGARSHLCAHRAQHVGHARGDAAADAVPLLHRGQVHHRHRQDLPHVHDPGLGVLSIHDNQVNRP